MFSNKEKCINPWVGFLIILFVCIMIATAIFFEFKGSRHSAKSHLKKAPQKNTRQAVPSNPAIDPGTAAGEKLVF